MKRRLWMIAAFVLVAAVVVGAVRLWKGAVAHDDALQLTPRDAFLYATVYLDPSNDQKRALRDLLERFPQTGSPEEVDALLARFLDEPLEKAGLDFERDVRPWLGGQIALFLLPPEGAADDPDGALLIAVTDEHAARDAAEQLATSAPGRNRSALRSRSYRDVEYRLEAENDTAFGFVDGFLVVGSEAGFRRAVDTTAESSLGESEKFGSAFDEVPRDHAALVYTNFRLLFDVLAREDPSQDLARGLLTSGMPSLAVVVLHSDAVHIEGTGGPLALPAGPFFETWKGTPMLARLPASSAAALAVADIGVWAEEWLRAAANVSGSPLALPALKSQFRAVTGLDLDREVWSWMGDAGVFVTSGLAGPAAGMIIETTDEDLAEQVLRKIAFRLVEVGISVEAVQRDRGRGFVATSDRFPVPIEVIHGEDLIIAAGPTRERGLVFEDQMLEGDELFARATASLGDAFEPSLFVDFAAVRVYVETFLGEALNVSGAEIRPWLGPVSHVSLGISRQGNLQRVVIGIR